MPGKTLVGRVRDGVRDAHPCADLRLSDISSLHQLMPPDTGVFFFFFFLEFLKILFLNCLLLLLLQTLVSKADFAIGRSEGGALLCTKPQPRGKSSTNGLAPGSP